jgi:hypothetical protein
MAEEASLETLTKSPSPYGGLCNCYRVVLADLVRRPERAQYDSPGRSPG